MSQLPIPPGLEVLEKSRRVRAVFAKVRADFPDIYEKDTELLLDPHAVSMVLDECDFSLSDRMPDARDVRCNNALLALSNEHPLLACCGTQQRPRFALLLAFSYMAASIPHFVSLEVRTIDTLCRLGFLATLWRWALIAVIRM